VPCATGGAVPDEAQLAHIILALTHAFSALALLVAQHEEHWPIKIE